MKNFIIAIHMVVLIMITSSVYAGIPEPDAILYGRITVGEGDDARPVSANDNLQVIARVEGIENPVGIYKMGENATIGDMYALRIRLESLADGSSQSNNKALIGQTAQIYLKPSGKEELFAFDFELSVRGIALEQNLTDQAERTTDPDTPGDGDIDIPVGNPLPTGSGLCGMTGTISLLLSGFFLWFIPRKRRN